MKDASDDCKIGYEEFSDEISTLVDAFPPPFIYINDATSPRLTAAAVAAVLKDIHDKEPGGLRRVHYAMVNAVACFTTRLLYDSTLNALTRWSANWADGCANWGLEDDTQRFNENFDGFIHGLRAISAYLCSQGKGKGKGKQKAQTDEEDVRLVIVIERAERLKETLPDILVPLTRLAELTQLDLSVIFISEVRWEDMRPSLGASPDPYFIDIPPPTKEIIVRRVTSEFPISDDPRPSPYHPSLAGLYSHFVTVLCDVCFPFIHDTQEIAYIAAARWPGFVQPVLDDYRRAIQTRRDEMDLDDEDDDPEPPFASPSEDVRMRLSRLFNTSLNMALEELYPRLTNASDWASRNKPEPDLFSKQPAHFARATEQSAKRVDDGTQALPRMSKFILVAAFLASTNPAKSDLRMFGRGLDEKKRKRRSRKTMKSGQAKVPQRLLGPLAFPLDRLLAILGALLEENDAETRLPAPEYTIPGEYTDVETSRVGIYSAIMELAAMRLLHRTSPGDRIDGPPSFKCGISYDVALALARQLAIPLNDLLWDPA
ncbi:putative origin recognition complex (ORC) subunit 5 C-terminus [Lyophyllum shimeji]|uniref:Origin recognition complex (ORC) subunit 5 C-terminus n=1 Tax=Lyophyllum shimeji TaxID=47721 RepID=A0A9P3PSW1_LYOSH|nr:putative origin recognition complex (ORC) subunit 5 C-terminus [Lyophyllum shimeji]